jgi:pyruvate dehydrogenase (quinone)/pyruvate oxidase
VTLLNSPRNKASGIRMPVATTTRAAHGGCPQVAPRASSSDLPARGSGAVSVSLPRPQWIGVCSGEHPAARERSMHHSNGADDIIDTLIEWGVTTIFGLPGDGINGLMEALRTRQDRIRFVQVRHEESAAFMACAHAKYTGQLGACLATSGPGGLHLLNGLYDAKLDGQPVIAITGHTYHDLIDTFSQQDVDLDRVFQDVSVYTTRVMSASHAESVTHLACRSALAHRGVAHLNVPVDVQTSKSSRQRSVRNVADHSSGRRATSAARPVLDDVQRAAALLNDARRVVILAGRGALDAADELEAVAECVGGPIVKALLGKAAVPDDSPYTTGGLGLLGTAPSQDALERCDAILIAGSSFPYVEFLPKPGQARGVQIDRDPVRIGLRYPVDVGLVGDCRETLRLLLDHLVHKPDRSFLEHARASMVEWRRVLETREAVQSDPMKPERLAAELGRHLRADAIVSCDSGTSTVWWARHVAARRGQMHSVSGSLASMGCALPYAIAAQLAFPERQCVAIAGDGALSMLMAELATCVKYRLPVRIVVVKNNTLGHIKWEQMVFLGNPEFGCDLEPIDFAAVARACGVPAFAVSDAAACAAVCEEAFRTPGPVLIEASTDPFEPPMPARVTARDAAHFAEALATGTPNRRKIVATIAADTVREVI